MKGKSKPSVQACDAGNASIRKGASAVAAAAAGPGPGPGSSMRRCELCGCYVPGSEQSWQTHTTGEHAAPTPACTHSACGHHAPGWSSGTHEWHCTMHVDFLHVTIPSRSYISILI
jgi:hypothetical protein